MGDLMKDLGDACMCGEPFYGRPCLWCKAKERIAELEKQLDTGKSAYADLLINAAPLEREAQGLLEEVDDLKAENERLRAALREIEKASGDDDDADCQHYDWIRDTARRALREDEDEH